MTDKGRFRAVVIGGGLSGLAAAWLMREEAAAAGVPLDLTLLEADKRSGGKIGTIDAQGFLCEIGPNGFLDNKPQTLQLCGRMGISNLLLRSNDSARKRYIFTRGKLEQLPEEPLAFLTSELVSIRGKLRIAAEYLVPQKKKGGADELLADFVRRRMGQEALDVLIGPMASGIYAGDPENMSLAACFPKIVAMEENFGGLLKGMLAMKKMAAAAGKQGPAGAGPGGVLTSFSRGIEELIRQLAERLGGSLRTSAPATALAREDVNGRPRWRVTVGDGSTLEADVVTLAVPAYDAAGLIGTLDPGIAATMRTVPYVPMAVVHMGFRETDLPRPLDGFGFLIPFREGRKILGALWASTIFAGRAPSGHVLITCMAGGAKARSIPFMDESALIELVRDEVGVTMGIRREPVFTQVLRWERAIPQYTYGHPERVASIEKRIAEQPGLLLTGNAWHGIGVNDCVASGMQSAAAAVTYLQRLSA